MKVASGQEWGSWCYRRSGMLFLLEVLELLICVLSILQLLLQLLLSPPLQNKHEVSVLALDFLIQYLKTVSFSNFQVYENFRILSPPLYSKHGVSVLTLGIFITKQTVSQTFRSFRILEFRARRCTGNMEFQCWNLNFFYKQTVSRGVGLLEFSSFCIYCSSKCRLQKTTGLLFRV